jgi:hypothetical protein
VSAGEVLLWIIFPYVAMATFVVAHWWRYRTDQFGWTSASTQLLERNILGWASPMFHYGALMAVGGHVIGLMIPKSLTETVGMSEHTYRWFSAIAGAVAGADLVNSYLDHLCAVWPGPSALGDNTIAIDCANGATTEVAPELGEWAAFFASTASRRSAIEAGRTDVVSPREADDLLRDAEAFHHLVESALGLPYQDRVDLLVILLQDLRKEREAAEKKAGKPLPDWPKRERTQKAKRSRR